MPENCGISAVVTAYQLREALFTTLRKLGECRPPPDEIIVHVDAGRVACRDEISARFPDIRILFSTDHVGPGGGRNKLIAAAKSDYVASFDDDSHPLDTDYFERVRQVVRQHPEAAMIATEIFLRDEPVREAHPAAAWVSDFVGCGCVYRRETFLATSGYVPLPIAYAMEEVDLALRLHAMGCRILHSCDLRVVHDTDNSHHADPAVISASISNLGLFAFLRYPMLLLWLGPLQVLNRLIWLFTHGRRVGIVTGLTQTPSHIWLHRSLREPVRARSLISYLRLKRHPIALPPTPAVAPRR